MKKIISKLKILFDCKSLLVVSILLCFACSFFACSKQSELPDSANGFTVSGQITADELALSNVGVLKNGEHFLPTVTTNASGIFHTDNLAENDVLSFYRNGYRFLPATYIVKEHFYDLRVIAIPTQTETEHEPDGNQEPNNPNVTPKIAMLSIESNASHLVDNTSGEWSAGDTITLSAHETDGWRFVGWYRENLLLANGTSLLVDFVIAQSTTIEARFEQVPLSPVLQWNAESDTLSWLQVENTIRYNIYIDENLIKTTTDTSMVLDSFLEIGDNNLFVEAIGNQTFNGRASHGSNLTINCKKRISCAKNIGFLQNQDKKLLVFEFLTQSETCSDCADGFSLFLQKNNAIWRVDVQFLDFLQGFVVPATESAPEAKQLLVSLNLVPDSSYPYLLGYTPLDLLNSSTSGMFDNSIFDNLDDSTYNEYALTPHAYSLQLTASLTSRNIGALFYNTVAIDFTELLASDMFELISSYVDCVDSNESQSIPQLDSIQSVVGDYLFTIVATTQNQDLRHSEPADITYCHEVFLDAPTCLTFTDSTTTPDDSTLTFYDSNLALFSNNDLRDGNIFLTFELILNGVKVSSVLYTDCLLPPNAQTETKTHSIDISNYLPENIDDLASISVIVTAQGFTNSTIATLLL